MYTRTYKIAEKIIEITSIYEAVHLLCADYIWDGQKGGQNADDSPDFSVTITQKDIDFEHVKSAAEDKKEGLAVRMFSDEYLETLAVYRQIAEKMVEYDTILFHGSVVSVDGQAYLFTAKSGTGKSTHTRLWRQMFGKRAVMVNDDKPLIKISDDGVTVFGTPWDGKHKLSNNIAVPLKAVCILRRGAENEIKQVDKSTAYPMILQQSYRSGNGATLMKTLHLLDGLMAKTKLYQLHCNMDIEAAQVAYDGVVSNKL